MRYSSRPPAFQTPNDCPAVPLRTTLMGEVATPRLP
ncbi:Uncharacterised protein [Vibrio cholerae]|nr:Uncharacterised protein [Vibrio cholerae]